MRLEVNGILADANCEGHLALLLRLFQQHWRQEVWEFLRLTQVSFADLGLPPGASDREVWEVQTPPRHPCHQWELKLTGSSRGKSPLGTRHFLPYTRSMYYM